MESLLNPGSNSESNLVTSYETCDPVLLSCNSSSDTTHDSQIEGKKQLKEEETEEEELKRLLLPNVDELPEIPRSSVEANFTTYFLPDFMKPGHDQYVHRHANGLCVIGLAPSHVAFKDEGGVTSIDFNVGKSDRSGIKVTGKRKKFALVEDITVLDNRKNAQHFESNTALCKVCTADASYIVRCCVKGSLLEVNETLISQPELLNSVPDREGYIAIMMPRPADWLKAKATLLDSEQFKKLKTEL